MQVVKQPSSITLLRNEFFNVATRWPRLAVQGTGASGGQTSKDLSLLKINSEILSLVLV